MTLFLGDENSCCLKANARILASTSTVLGYAELRGPDMRRFGAFWILFRDSIPRSYPAAEYTTHQIARKGHFTRFIRRRSLGQSPIFAVFVGTQLHEPWRGASSNPD